MARLYRYVARFLGYDAVSLDDNYPAFRRSYLKVTALLFIAQSGKTHRTTLLRRKQSSVSVKCRVVWFVDLTAHGLY